MFDPLEFLDPILHILNFVFKIFDIAKSYLLLLIANVGSFSRWVVTNDEKSRNIVISIGSILGLYLLYRRGVSLDRSSKAAQKQAENAEIQLNNVEKQNENAWKSHVADTYTRAIEQLGSVDSKGEPRLELRLGGLYALEKIAKANEDYHPQIMEVLCAYVRLHCPKDTDFEENDSEQRPESPRIDIQACLTVIGRRENSFDKGSKLDLSRIQINDVFLANANLSEVGLFKADLQGAFLNNANLSGATLSETNLARVILSGVDLRGAWLMKAKNLTCEQIQSAKIDRDTILPDYIKVTWAEDGTPSCEMVEGSG